ncbi:MAG: hypothetical protein M0R39_17095 [Prolixibacteraceae bacterium]|nr:hypothetical protein [Prolixibacteraceae bacterium]
MKTRLIVLIIVELLLAFMAYGMLSVLFAVGCFDGCASSKDARRLEFIKMAIVLIPLVCLMIVHVTRYHKKIKIINNTTKVSKK